jgi:amino acid permease
VKRKVGWPQVKMTHLYSCSSSFSIACYIYVASLFFFQAALAIPGGIAAFGNAPQAVIPAVVIILAMGLINAYTFSLIGRVCAITGATSYGQAWEMSVGKRGAGIVAFVCTFKPALGNLAYSMILADAFKPLLETVAGLDWSRTKTLWIITVLLIWPLCLLKNLKVLAPFSILGLIGMVLIIFVTTLRYFDGTYDPSSPNERFIEDLSPDMQPKFGTVGISGLWNAQVLTLVCMLATAYVAHYNAPRFYIELKNNTLKRYNTVVTISYIASATFYVVSEYPSAGSMLFIVRRQNFGYSLLAGLIMSIFAPASLTFDNLSIAAIKGPGCDWIPNFWSSLVQLYPQ